MLDNFDVITLVLLLFPFLMSIIMLTITGVVSESSRNKLAPVWRMASLGVSMILFIVASLMFTGQIGGVDWMGIGFNQYEFVYQYEWISSLGITWQVGLDALSFPMVWLTTFLLPVTIIATWDEKKGAVYHPLVLLMGATLLGVFVSLDLFMFYIFWELTLIPMFFLILKWGGKDRKYASQKFFIYTFTASVIMLLGLITMYFSMPSNTEIAMDNAGEYTGRTFDLLEITNIANAANSGGVWLENLHLIIFAMLMIGFLVKLPAAPFHTWLPDAHVQAPTGGSMLLAGVMLKMGAYGMFRIPATLFPHALEHFQFVLMLFGFVSLVYGAIVCLGQTNLKKMVAYSSVSHMGVILLGIASMQPIGWAAALFMMFAHGIISPMLFAVCGAFKHHYHSMEIGAMRGMAKHSPWLATSMMFGWMASLGLPLLAGFVAEFLLLIAYWHEFGWWILGPGLALAITAAYYLWSMQRTIFEGGEDTQPPKEMEGKTIPDIGDMEKVAMLILAGFTILFGIFPAIALDMMSDWTVTMFETLFGGA